MPKAIASVILTVSMLITGSHTVAGTPQATTTTVATVVTTTTTTLVSNPIMAKWDKVAWCETNGDWDRVGRIHSGGLGITPWNWSKNGGLAYAPTAAQATPPQQVRVAENIQVRGHVAGYVPDQYGYCTAW